MIQSIENGRKEDGNRSIADKIIKRLHDLDKTVENNLGRWAWELLQNAKDSIADDVDSRVSVEILLESDQVTFSHNGLHFSEKDIRGLINQISSKEVAEGEVTKRTGRFGTGFLTTHLLSRKVQVVGIVETADGKFYSFQFLLDREGNTTSELIPKIENSWASFHSSARIVSNYDRRKFNTSFSYRLKDERQKEIARKGYEEFSNLIPFVLAFIPKIESVSVIDRTASETIELRNSREYEGNFILKIFKTTNGIPSIIRLGVQETDRLSIAVEVAKTIDSYRIKSSAKVPKLFCDFPLIGTEDFYFPVVVNSFYFNPQTERDGVWLKGRKDYEDNEVKENQDLLLGAVKLYRLLLTKVCDENYTDLYNVADTRLPIVDTKFFDESWYMLNIQKPLRDTLLKTKVVELNIEEAENQLISNVFFPSSVYPTDVRESLWQIIFDLHPGYVPKREHIHHWIEISWEGWQKITYSLVMASIAKIENIGALSSRLQVDAKKSMSWLNQTCKMIIEDESNITLFDKYAVIPNRYGDFKLKADLRIDKIEDVDLIEVLTLLGEDWKEILLHKSITFGTYFTKTRKDIAVAITDRLKGNAQKTPDGVKAINILSEWFETRKAEGKELFSELYKRKAELFMNTIEDKESLYKVMRSKTNLAELSKVADALDLNPNLLKEVESVTQFAALLKEFNIQTIDDLRIILNQGGTDGRLKIALDVDALIGLGITSLEEFEEKFRDRDLAAIFTHTSTPSAAMYISAQKLIARAKTNVISHLRTLDQYDLSDMEEVAKTILAGIRKDGLEIHIVIRPSDNGYAIVFYNSEKDTLDYANAELWIDNGLSTPRLLTLGRILKNTGINKIPVE